MSTARKNRKSGTLEGSKTFVSHIAELQVRLLWVAGVFLLASALAYNFREPLVDLVLSPIDHQKLVYLTPGGGFSFIFQIMIYAGMLVAAPVLIVQLYGFIKPALPDRARRYSARMAIASLVLLISGASFGYLVAIPAALQFLMNFAGEFVTPNLTADSYLNFVVAYIVGLAILFQLPLLLIMWNWISPLPPGKLWASQQYVLVFAFIAAALITPTPDAVNQVMVAGPIIAIYQLGVVSVYTMNKRERRRVRRAAQKDAIATPQLLEKPVVLTTTPQLARSTQLTSQEAPHIAKRPVHQSRPAVSLDGMRPRQRPSRLITPSRQIDTRQAQPTRVNRRSSVDGFAIR